MSSLIAVVISDEGVRKNLVKILSRNPSNIITAQPFVPDIVSFLKSGGFNVAIVDAEYLEKAPDTDIKGAVPSTNVIGWINKYDAQRAVSLISAGAMDVLCAPSDASEILAVVGHHLGGFYLKRKTDYTFFSKISRSIRYPLVIFSAIIVVLFLTYFMAKKLGIFASADIEKEGVYTLNVQSPTGLWIERGRIYVSDWISQTIVGFKTDNQDMSTREVESYYLADCNPLFVAKCGDSFFTASAGADDKGTIRKYAIKEDAAVLIEKFSSPGPSPSGFTFCKVTGDKKLGRFAYSVDSQTRKIYQHLASAGYPVVNSYNFAGLVPVGIVFDGKYFFIADSKGARIYKHIGPSNNFVPVAAYNVRLHGADKEITGFFKSRKNFYIVGGANPARLYVISYKSSD